MKLATLFCDGAVLQRDAIVPVWGWTNPGAFVSAEINGTKACARASQDGYFILRFTPMTAGGPYELSIKDEDNNETITIRDVMVGEVWLASGQSNMQITFSDDWTQPPGQNQTILKQRDEFIALTAGKEHLIRAINVPMVITGGVQQTFQGEWNNMDAEHAVKISSVALWHAYYLQQKLGVTVGIVASAWGGTLAEAWTSREALIRNPDTYHLAINRDLSYADRNVWEASAEVNTFSVADIGISEAAGDWAKDGVDESEWLYMTVPGSWIRQGIAGNGAVWMRRTIELPRDMLGKELTLIIGGVDKQDITYFNGVEIGRTGADLDINTWDTERRYIIPQSLVREGANTIAIRGYSFIYDGSIATSGGIRLVSNDGFEIDLAGAWRANPEINHGILAPAAGAVSNPTNPNTPAILFDDMIAPLIPYAIKGAIWYQGESNGGTKLAASTYKSKLKSMIDDWRYRWGQGDFPFIQVELAAFREPVPYSESEAWPVLRDAQLRICKEMDNVYLASAIDVGHPTDIHPQDKKTVGYRMAQIALNKHYNQNDVMPCGPIFKSVQPEGGNKIRVTFENGDGLYFDGGIAKGFYIAGTNNIFRAATEAVVEGNSIVLYSRTVPYPIHVRYSWADNPNGNLRNSAGLPASAFRTDDNNLL